MGGSVFISYASKDLQIAERICVGLERRGLTCWMAGRNVEPGENFAEAIPRAIAAARVMIVVFSAHANNSAEIQKELALADRNGLAVIPARIANIEPTNAFSYQLVTRQWVDMFRDWDASLSRLASRVMNVIGAKSAPEPARAPGKVTAPIPPPNKPPGPAGVAVAPSRRRRLSLVMLGSAALIGAMGLGWFVFSSGDPPISLPKSFAEQTKPPASSNCQTYQVWCH
jgi:hypothetical protein